jgi:hypothetical protein
MQIAKTKVWEHLREEEKSALTLAYVNGKSSWQAGSILSKSHYKYLEILNRATHFVKMFTEFYNMHLEFLPEGVSVHPTIHEYLKLTMLKRLKPTEAIRRIGNPIFIKPKNRAGMIIQEMEKWQNSKDPFEVRFAQFVFEFDRWNNYRILPKEIQEPHAFKRRNKNFIKSLIFFWFKAKEEELNYVKALIKYKIPKTKIGTEHYVGIMRDVHAGVYEIIKVKPNHVNTLRTCYENKLFVFKEYKDCRELMDLVVMYYGRNNTDTLEGLKFWPSLREIIVKAENYQKIMGIVPNRTILHTDAYKNQYNNFKGRKTTKNNLF